MENMRYWDALKQPPETALKRIQGGRLSGKTDINPQWRYQVMTEQFGVCGIGWKYNINKLWLEPVGDEIAAFADIGLSIKVDGEWSEPIPGIGGSMLLEQETKGLHSSDECYKMAITDALSVAMKMIGVAADIYAGKFDGSKYQTDNKAPTQKSQKATTKAKDTRSHWCKRHETKYFKTEKMNSFGHPIADTNEWCWEPKQKAKKDAPPPLKNAGELMSRAAKFGISSRDVCEANGVGKSEDIKDLDAAWVAVATKFKATIKSAQETPAPDSSPYSSSEPEPAAEPAAAPAPTQDAAEIVAWIKESLPKIKWPEKTAASWLASKFQLPGGLLDDLMLMLPDEQMAIFVKEIKDRLEMA